MAARVIGRGFQDPNVSDADRPHERARYMPANVACPTLLRQDRTTGPVQDAGYHKEADAQCKHAHPRDRFAKHSVVIRVRQMSSEPSDGRRQRCGFRRRLPGLMLIGQGHGHRQLRLTRYSIVEFSSGQAHHSRWIALESGCLPSPACVGLLGFANVGRSAPDHQFRRLIVPPRGQDDGRCNNRQAHDRKCPEQKAAPAVTRSSLCAGGTIGNF